jgi:hypothetical protein
MSRGIPAFAEQQLRTETMQAMRAILREEGVVMGSAGYGASSKPDAIPLSILF